MGNKRNQLTKVNKTQKRNNRRCWWRLRCRGTRKASVYSDSREFKQIATAGATTAAVIEKVWGEYVSVVCQILAKRNTKMSET